MAIAFVKGQLTRDPFFREGDKADFAACSLKEVYTDRSGEERLGGYHDVVAFGDNAHLLAALEEGDTLEVKANIRYRPDDRFVHKNDENKNPFVTQFVVIDVQSSSSSAEDEDDDPFAGA